MCRTLVEIQYLECNHFDTWEIPSPLAHCTGVIHRITLDSLTKCKHCWVQDQGYPKKEWKRVRIFLWKRQPFTFLLHVRTHRRPIQSVDAVRTADCPMWERRYGWQTRTQILREIKLRRMDIQREIELSNAGFFITRNPRGPGHLAPFYNTDEGMIDSGLLRLVEPEDAFPPNGRCAFCYSYFVQEDTEQDYAGREGNLRTLDCSFHHTFCLDCIMMYFLSTRDTRAVQVAAGELLTPYRCPYCREQFSILFHERTNMKLRLAHLFAANTMCMHQGQGHGDPNYPIGPERVITVRDWIGYSAGLVFALPMVFAVEHSMGIFQSRSGPAGRLPFLQIVIVGLTGMVLQLFWIPFILFAPFIYVFYQLKITEAVAASLLSVWKGVVGLFGALIDGIRDFFRALVVGLRYQYHYQADF